jgi:photosystem II stability/assembly factor-like uncharacterized protein
MKYNGINYLISKNLISENTGVLKINYDFSYTGSYINMGGGNITVKSLSSGDQTYSGKISLILNEFEDNESYNIYDQLNKNNEYINLYGNRFDEDYYISSRIEIKNYENLYTGNGFTFVIYGGKIPRDEIKLSLFDHPDLNEQKPFHNKEIIFSNIIPSNEGYSGWEFGLNSANLFYFRTYDANMQKVFTFDKERPMGENIWGLKYSNKQITISRYNHVNRSITSQLFQMADFLKSGNVWYINSGNNSELISLNNNLASNITSSIKLRNFMYFNEDLSDDIFLDISTNISSNIQTKEIIINSGYYYDATGTEITCYEESGLLYVTGVLSGFESFTITGTGAPIYTPLYGQVINFSQALEQCASSELFNLTLITGGGGLQITGYSIFVPKTEYNINIPIYVNSGVSGIIYSGCTTQDLTGEFYFEETGYQDVSDNNYDINLNSRSVSHIGQRYEQDFIENIIDENFVNYKNKIGQKINSSYEEEGKTFFIENNTGEYDKNIIFYLNGIAQRYGTGILEKINISGVLYDKYNLEKDYFIDQNSQIVYNIKFTGNDEIQNLHSIYDIRNKEIESAELEYNLDIMSYFNFSYRYINKIESSSDGKYILCKTNIGSLLTSNDYGNTFNNIEIINNEEEVLFSDVNISKDGKYQIAVSTVEGVYESNDYGNKWFNSYNGGNYHNIAISKNGKTRTLISSDFEPILCSYDYGATWNDVGEGGGSYIFNSISISSDGRHQLAGTQTVLLVNNNFGSENNWQERQPLKYWKKVLISLDGKYQYAITNQELWFSDNYGENFILRYQPSFFSLKSISISENGKNVFLYINSTTPWRNRILYSNNYGRTFIVLLNNTSFGYYFGDINFNNNNILYSFYREGIEYSEFIKLKPIYKNILESKEILINNTGDYSQEFTGIYESGLDIFLNGVKIYQNIDYRINKRPDEEPDFNPINNSLNVTGIYFSYPNNNGYLYYTGNNYYDIYENEYIKNNSVLSWVNGVRKNPEEYIYHDIYVDLITGIYIGNEVISNQEILSINIEV